MKDINPSPEAVAKVEALIDELYDTCVMNDIPLVVGALVNRRATPRGEMVNRLLFGPSGWTSRNYRFIPARRQ
ncbi:hypothetical protein AIT68_004906 [Salmonella enterica subsp. salamae]|uniref:hypothetical protein n=1 Tax=Salmonella enterica TaxID=28901 RepID=UPI0009E903CF|nr:hypothetical protein [Salmonella enterica]EBQ5245627.1 hypothetical protein [Salmonella enterica subsp. salamae]